MTGRRALQTAVAALSNLALGTNLAALTMLRRPEKMFSYVSECLFLYKAVNSSHGIIRRNVFEVLSTNDVETIALGDLKSHRGYMHEFASYTADIVNLCLICKIMKPRVVFEIGTLQGYTALHFALNTPDDAKIFTLDLPKDTPQRRLLPTTFRDDKIIAGYLSSPSYLFERSPAASKITCLFGDSATFDFSNFHGKVDFFFIDGSHSYEYVRSDTQNALKCCRPGGLIAWHDFGKLGSAQGVSKWVLELSRDREIFALPGGSLAFMIHR